jgi:hypothetical protein
MTIPRFTAEASLNAPAEFYRALQIDGQIQWGHVLPQMTALTFETTGCNFQICTLTIHGGDRPPTFTCTQPTNICFDRPRDAGIPNVPDFER